MAVDRLRLDNQVKFYQSLAFTDNTKKAYRVHRKCYLSFCQRMGVAPVPASSQLLCQYAAFLSNRLKYQSVKQYMNIIRLLHKEWGLPNPCEGNFSVAMTLRGIRRHLGDKVTRKAPMTPDLLRSILESLDVSSLFGASIWAAALLMFFGLLRRSNVLVPETGFDPNKHLRRSDLSFSQEGLRVRIRWTKTLQYKQSVLLIPYPWDKGNPLCPTQAVFNAVRLSPAAPAEGPALVLDKSGRPSPLTPSIFITRIRGALQGKTKDVKDFAGHSFRRGGATWAFSQDISVDQIKLLGQWSSDAYAAYILPTNSGLSKTTHTMVTATRR